MFIRLISMLCCLTQLALPALAVRPGGMEDIALKDIYQDYFLIGTAGEPSSLANESLALMTRHFNAFTFENRMKPEFVQRAEGVFTFDTVNAMVDTLKANDMNIIGHTLAWHSQTPEWFWSDAAKARERLETHIEAVLNEVGEDLLAVDVVNEAVLYSGQENWRDNLRGEGWFSVLGPDFIEIAFRKAAQVRDAIGRPDLKLYYNDYGLDDPKKSAKVYEMVAELRSKGVPIDGIGMQGHYTLDLLPDNVANSLTLFSSIPGIEVSVTELDVAIGSARGNGALSKAEHWMQAYLYAKLFSIYKQYAKGPANTSADPSKQIIARVSFWGLTDGVSWGAEQFPLLFDKDARAKRSFYAVTDPEGTLQQMGRRSECTFAALRELCRTRYSIQKSVPWVGVHLGNAMQWVIDGALTLSDACSCLWQAKEVSP